VILIGIYLWNIIVFFFFGWLLSFRMSTLNSPIMMIRQFSRDYWIIVWRLFKNVKIEHEWTLYTHTICIVFHVLILKVDVIYYEPSLVTILKESRCMCMSYIIINLWSSWIEIYEYFDEFINLCTSIDTWCILVSIIHKIWNIECYDHDWCLHNVGIKKLYSRLV
jgi:hypothetical protein